MDIHSLVKQFLELGGAEVGRGPRHPLQPNPALAITVADFLDQYSFLKEDPGYVEFLECYAGAFAYNSRHDNFAIDIFGFTNVSSNLISGEGQIVDEEGFLAFADGFFQRENKERADLLGAAFDATGERQWGVYRVRRTVTLTVESYWYCNTFLEWFAILIASKGHMPETLESP